MSSNSSCDDSIYNLVETVSKKEENYRQIAIIANVMMCLLPGPTAVLNIMVLVTIWRKVSLRTASNLFLCNLALSDLAVSIICEPLYAVVSLNKLHTCTTSFVISLLSTGLTTASYLTVVSSTVERYMVLSYPLQHSSMVTICRVAVLCVVVWIVSSVVGVLFSMYRFFAFAVVAGVTFSICIMAFCQAVVALIPQCII